MALEPKPLTPEMEPVRLVIKDGYVQEVEGGDPEGRARARVLESDRYLDSWHCGINPKTVIPVKRTDNPRKWYSYAHCSPQMVHFHLGRTHSTINVGSMRQSLEIDGDAIYRDGAFADFSDPKIDRALSDAGQRTDALRTEPIAF